MSDKCFIPGGHHCSDSQDQAYPLQTSEREGNPTKYQVNSSRPDSVVSNNQQILIASPYQVTTTLKRKPGQNKTNTDICNINFTEAVPTEVLLCAGS